MSLFGLEPLPRLGDGVALPDKRLRFMNDLERTLWRFPKLRALLTPLKHRHAELHDRKIDQVAASIMHDLWER